MIKYKLKDLCDLQNGFAFKSSDYIEKSNTLCCRMSNIRPNSTFDVSYNPKYLPDIFKDKYKNFLLKDGDIIIAMTDMASNPKILGVPTIVKTEGFNLLLNQRVGKLFNFNHNIIYIPFLKRILSDVKYKSYYKKFAGGGVQLNISKDKILNINLSIPKSLTDQKRIAKVLSDAETLISQRKESIALLDELLKSTFLDMFGDPVHNEKGWETKTIEELVKKDKYSIKRGPFGGALKKEIFVKEGYLVYEQFHALNNDFSMARYFIDENKFNELKAFVVNSDDIIISCSGVNLGRLAIIPKGARKGIINQALLKISLDEKKMLNVFYLFTFTNEHFKMKFFGNTRGSGVPNFPPMSVFKKFKFPQPPIELQNKFAQIVEQTELIKKYYEDSLQELENLYGSISQLAFKGELDLSKIKLASYDITNANMAMVAENEQGYSNK